MVVLDQHNKGTLRLHDRHTHSQKFGNKSSCILKRAKRKSFCCLSDYKSSSNYLSPEYITDQIQSNAMYPNTPHKGACAFTG